jgi:hypothetical protein
MTVTEEKTKHSAEATQVKDAETFMAAAKREQPQKRLRDTAGAKMLHFFTYYVMGFVANSSLSLVFTYLLNPQPKVKAFREKTLEKVGNIFNGKDGKPNGALKYVADGLRSTVEILFMTVAGFTMTTLMTPLVTHKDKIAYRINKLLGKDTDILPDDMKPRKKPETLEELVEDRLCREVKRGYSAGDLWKGRVTSLLVPIFGDMGLNFANRKLEENGRQSLDTLAWRSGQKAYKQLEKTNGWLKKYTNFFKKNGAGIEDIKENLKEHYTRLENTERKYGNSAPGRLNEDSMIISEQTRIIGKEWGWTFINSIFVDKLTKWFHDRRVHKQEEKAVNRLREEHVLAENQAVLIADDGKVAIRTGEGTALQPGDKGRNIYPAHKRSHREFAQRKPQEAAVGV